MTNSQRQNNKINSKTKTLQQLQDTCLCQNKTPQLVTTVEENEIVCRNCGVVFGFDENENSDNTIPYQHITKSRINLYQKRQTGGNPHDVKKITHISNLRLEKNNNNSDIVSFADVCDKLKLSDGTSENCWRSYYTLKGQTGKFTKAKAMCLAIYQTCRFHHIPFDESKIRDIVCQSLGVKNAPTLKNVIFKITTDQKFINSEDNHNPFAKGQFYLNLHTSQAQKRYNIQDVTTLRRITTKYYESFTNSCFYNNDSSLFMKNADYNILAKRAVKLAVQRCIG